MIVLRAGLNHDGEVHMSRILRERSYEIGSSLDGLNSTTKRFHVENFKHG